MHSSTNDNVDPGRPSFAQNAAADGQSQLTSVESRPAEPASQPDAAPVPVDGRQSQRMDQIGALATGIAHEFNNLLTIAFGSLEQLRQQSLGVRGREQLDRAEWSVMQAGRLAQQILSFARPQAAEIALVDLNQVVADFDKIMNQAAGDTRLTLELAEQPLPVRLDAGQLELALLNLVRNAADAVAGGGDIRLRTASRAAEGLGGQPTVEVAVADNGRGMEPDVFERAGDAFFTTKEQGRGTGMGLWMVHRFVAASDGKVDIKTKLGQGTTVKLIFPGAEQA